MRIQHRPPVSDKIATMAIFVDSIMRTAIKAFRQESRRKAASKWALARATITKVGVGSAPEIRLHVPYTYEVSGETHYGSTVSMPLDADIVDNARKHTESLQALQIRYDSADPLESRALNQDNPALPFEVDQDPY
jgi:hypothetical protein